MKIRNVFLLFASGIVLFLIFGFLLIRSVKKSKDCRQFVIDSIEVSSGMNIPKQYDSKCYYFENEEVRMSVFQIDNTDEFVTRYQSKRMDDDTKAELWSPITSDHPLYNLSKLDEDFVSFAGINKTNSWQSFLNEKSGVLVFEIKWK